MQNYNILLVEDNPGDAMLLEELLLDNKRFTYKMSVADTLQAAIKMVEENRYDIILLDLDLPDSNGLDALQAINNKTNNTPILVITGLDDDKTGNEAIKMGAQSYIVKGLFNSRLITDSIIHALERNNNLIKIRKAEEELNRYNKELHKANREKERLIALLSHDLRGPIKTLVALLELLNDEYDEMEKTMQREIIKKSIKTGENTVNLLETLLDWARIKAGKIQIKPQNTEVHQFVNNTIESTLDIACQKDLEIINNTPDGLHFYADTNMIATVVRNLLGNAIKFSHRNSTISIDAKKTDNENIAIEIIDEGKGIKKEDLPKIFDITEGFTTFGTEDEKGSGFGMILCKELIEENNGELYIESEYGKGTCVRFILPGKQNAGLEE
ncbi:MAG: hybrid sensor histidine kinase/response regulator [Prolixibacteraceae bacterium]|nr:hybrid sensor histidine kinase/response regulator [Prolixibacteraceae bacterium]